MRSDRRGDAVVGRAHQVSSRFERAHARNLQMLVRRRRIAVPGIVGDVDEYRRLRNAPSWLLPNASS